MPSRCTAHQPKLPSVEEPPAELAAYFPSKSKVPDEDLLLLTAAARVGGGLWDAIAAACSVRIYEDTAGVICQPPGTIPDRRLDTGWPNDPMAVDSSSS
jgi:hypothetical protein